MSPMELYIWLLVWLVCILLLLPWVPWRNFRIRHSKCFGYLCYTMKGVRQVDDLFVCFGAKPNKGLSSISSTRPEVGNGTSQSSWKKEAGEKAVGEGWRRGAVDNGQQKEAVREGLSGWVGIHSNFVEISLEIHASVSLQMHRECSVTEPPFLHFELTEALIVRLFFVLFLPLLRLYFLCRKEMWYSCRNH